MSKRTVIITGTSSGIGLETALYFLEKQWNVVATMRNPEKRITPLHESPGIFLMHLDAMDPVTIDAVFTETIRRFGRIDCVVNNAGYGLFGAFEASTPEQIRKQFETNVFGLMEVCRAAIPFMRSQRGGTLVNVASMGGRITFPLFSLYHATKWAVEGFSESLQFELRPFNIKVRIVEPGPVKTDFYERSRDVTHREGLTAYNAFQQRVARSSDAFGENGASPRRVARKIYRAATGGWFTMRYPVWTLGTLTLRRFTPDAVFQFVIRTILRA